MPGNQLQSTDIYLVEATLYGDKKAYEQLVRRYQRLVYNLLYQLVKNHETAADLTQETFLRAFRGLSSFRLNASFKPWLLRIATNAGYNWLRDNKQTESLEALLDEQPGLEPAGKCDVEREVEMLLSQAMVMNALSQLNPRYRHVFLLRYQHDLTYEDICSVTGESLASIKSLLFRIRERLRKILIDESRGAAVDNG